MKPVTLDVKTPYQLDGKTITQVEIFYPNFAKFVAYSKEALRLQGKQRFETIFRSVRIINQTTLITSDGAKLKLTPETLHRMPRPVANLIIDNLAGEDDPKGKVLSDKDADGISIPILYQLGTPLIAADGKEMAELEFLAATYGDIEDVLGEIQTLDQTLALISMNAKPAGMLQLPSWAVEQVTLADGIAITELVLPRFLE